ncbi:MAG: SDR family oxidoreductase [Bacteroidota bacterium]
MKNKTVLVTGGTGYIGSWVVKELLEKSYTVRMTVRDKTRKDKIAHFDPIVEKADGKLELWEANLLTEGSFDDAAKGCDAVMHIASPFTLRFKNPQKDLIDPALLGTRNVLNAATRSGTVKKVILTSSVAAVLGDNIDMKKQGLSQLTEENFNISSTPTHQPYSFSKIAAEKEAWKISENQNQWKLIVLNPSFVLGPSLTAASDSESMNFMKDLLKGKFFLGAPSLMFGFVDVRDVAHAHILALENENASGRHILAERTLTIMGLSKILKRRYGKKYLLPLFTAPKALLILMGGLFGVTPKFVKRNVGYPIRLNTRKSKESLGVEYTNLELTLRDMVEQMQNQNIVK